MNRHQYGWNALNWYLGQMSVKPYTMKHDDGTDIQAIGITNVPQFMIDAMRDSYVPEDNTMLFTFIVNGLPLTFDVMMMTMPREHYFPYGFDTNPDVDIKSGPVDMYKYVSNQFIDIFHMTVNSYANSYANMRLCSVLWDRNEDPEVHDALKFAIATIKEKLDRDIPTDSPYLWVMIDKGIDDVAAKTDRSNPDECTAYDELVKGTSVAADYFYKIRKIASEQFYEDYAPRMLQKYQLILTTDIKPENEELVKTFIDEVTNGTFKKDIYDNDNTSDDIMRCIISLIATFNETRTANFGKPLVIKHKS